MASTSAAKPIYDAVKFADHTVIVMGGEGKGLHDLVKRNCDMLVKIPMAGEIASLNVRWRRESRCSPGRNRGA